MREAADATSGRWRWVVVSGCAPLLVCSQFYRVANAIVAPHLQRELGVSSEMLGGLTAAFFYAFAVTQIPLALLLDRLGSRTTMTGLSLVGAAGAVMFATARAPGAAIAGEALLGVGMAGNLMGSLRLVGLWFSRREFATVAGLLGALATLGNILATTPLAFLVEAIGWRRAFVAISLATATLAVVFWTIAREPPVSGAIPCRQPSADETIHASIRRLLSSKDYWLISLGAFCRYGAFASLQGLWAGPYLVEIIGMPPITAANLLLLLNLALVVGAPLGGRISDRLLSSRKSAVIIGLTGITAVELALAVTRSSSSVWIVALILAVLGVSSGFGQVAYVHVKELMPPRMSGMAMAGINLFTMLGAAAFLHGTGWVLDLTLNAAGRRTAEGYHTAFLGAAAVVALALLAYGRTRDPSMAFNPAAQPTPHLRAPR